jgi:hypothetical protein
MHNARVTEQGKGKRRPNPRGRPDGPETRRHGFVY